MPGGVRISTMSWVGPARLIYEGRSGGAQNAGLSAISRIFSQHQTAPRVILRPLRGQGCQVLSTETCSFSANSPSSALLGFWGNRRS
jgi:hypothetical protein